MSIKRGVITDFTSSSARSISVSSTLPIALVVTSANAIGEGVYGYDGLSDAVADMATMGVTLEDGTALKYLKLGELFNATAPIVLSVVKPVEDEAEMVTKVIEAVTALKTAPSVTGYKPDILVAPDFGFNVDVVNALVSVANNFRARAFVSLYAETNSEAITRRNNFRSERLSVIKSNGLINGEVIDGGALLAWQRVLTDASKDIGWTESISNRVLPISDVEHPSDFFPGQTDDTDPLTETNISSIIFYKGFRTWEYATTSADSILQDARRVRIFDLAQEAVIEGIFSAIDKGINELRAAKKSLRSFMADLVGASVMLGFNVSLDEERTTATAITNGEFYFIIEAQEMPSPRLIKVTFNRVDKYAETLYEILTAS